MDAAVISDNKQRSRLIFALYYCAGGVSLTCTSALIKKCEVAVGLTSLKFRCDKIDRGRDPSGNGKARREERKQETPNKAKSNFTINASEKVARILAKNARG